MRDWMNMGLNCQRQKMWPMNCDFREYEVCTNSRGGLLHRRRRTGLELLKLVFFFFIYRRFADILRCVAFCNINIIMKVVRFSAC